MARTVHRADRWRRRLGIRRPQRLQQRAAGAARWRGFRQPRGDAHRGAQLGARGARCRSLLHREHGRPRSRGRASVALRAPVADRRARGRSGGARRNRRRRRRHRAGDRAAPALDRAVERRARGPHLAHLGAVRPEASRPGRRTSCHRDRNQPGHDPRGAVSGPRAGDGRQLPPLRGCSLLRRHGLLPHSDDSTGQSAGQDNQDRRDSGRRRRQATGLRANRAGTDIGHGRDAPGWRDIDGSRRPGHGHLGVLHLRWRSEGAGFRWPAEPGRPGLRGIRESHRGHGRRPAHSRCARDGRSG